MTEFLIDRMDDHSRLEVIGVDSLMTIEVLKEIKDVFGITIPIFDLQELADLNSLCLYIQPTSHHNSGHVTLLEKVTNGAGLFITIEVSNPGDGQEMRTLQSAITASYTKPIMEMLIEAQGNFDKFSKLMGFNKISIPDKTSLSLRRWQKPLKDSVVPSQN